MNVGNSLCGASRRRCCSTPLAGSQALGFTRMKIPYMLGTLFTPNRDRACVYGVLLHLPNGRIFSLVYVRRFTRLAGSCGGRGVLIGLVHGASCWWWGCRCWHAPAHGERGAGSDGVRQLEPPGFLGANYCIQTPIWSLVSHAKFGAVLGAFYSQV